VRALLHEHADPNATNHFLGTPLLIAVEKGFDATVQVLLNDPRTNVDQARDNGETPLGVASYRGHMSVVRMLLGADADATLPGGGGRTPLQLAEYGNREGVARLLANTAELVEIGCQQPESCAALTACDDDMEQATEYLMHGRHLARALQLLAFVLGVQAGGEALNEDMPIDLVDSVCAKHPWPSMQLAGSIVVGTRWYHEMIKAKKEGQALRPRADPWSRQVADFCLHQIVRGHVTPLTNATFNRAGTKVISSSYDRTCKVWDSATGEKLLALEGHKNVVYASAFDNTPIGEKIVTISFDKTTRIWDANTGECLHALRGHTSEVVCVAFNPQSTVVATGGMDHIAMLWLVESGELLASLTGHDAEIVGVTFNHEGDKIVTASFDCTLRIWEVPSGQCIQTLAGHTGEISSCTFNMQGDLCVSGSTDHTCKIWSVATGQCTHTLRGHSDDILDVAFHDDLVATAAADDTVRVYHAETGTCSTIFSGHTGEVSQVKFSPSGSRIITASSDKTCRLVRPSHVDREPQALQLTPVVCVCSGMWRRVIACRCSRVTLMRYSRASSARTGARSSPVRRITHAGSGMGESRSRSRSLSRRQNSLTGRLMGRVRVSCLHTVSTL
jgi:dynein assembly factor with WDR repeat domains 1